MMLRQPNHKQRKARLQELKRLLGREPFWDFYPDFKSGAQDEGSLRLEALEKYAQDLWVEGLRCYVDDSFCACIAVCSFALEAALKHQLEIAIPSYNGDDTLGSSIWKCRTEGILPDDDNNPVTLAAMTVNRARNDIVHSKVPRRCPESILFGEGKEHETIGESGIKLVVPFKNLATDTIKSADLVLRYLQSSRHKAAGNQV